MEKVGVKIKLLHPDAKIPKYGTNESAGFDFYSVEDAIILPGELKMLHTGISLEFPKGFHVQIWDRSGKAKEGVHLFAGVAGFGAGFLFSAAFVSLMGGRHLSQGLLP